MTLKAQTEGMRLLRRRYPHAAVSGAVYHGTDRPPSEVLEKGLLPTGGDSFDLEAHQRQSREQRSALRGSSLTAMTPAGFAGVGSWVYRLVPVGGGIDVNAALGPKRVNFMLGRLEGSVVPGELEIAIGGEQPACQIEGYQPVVGYHESSDTYRLGAFVPNPGFKPGAWEGRQTIFQAADQALQV